MSSEIEVPTEPMQGVEEKKISLDPVEDSAHVKLLGEEYYSSEAEIEVEEPPKILCKTCGEELEDEKVDKCPKCNFFVVKPGGVYDLSQGNFTLPNVLAARLPPTQFQSDKWQAPFPAHVTNDTIATDREANEWIINHFPLTDEQKKDFIVSTLREQGDTKNATLIERQFHKEETRMVVHQNAKKTKKLEAFRKKLERGRLSVKDSKSQIRR